MWVWRIAVAWLLAACVEEGLPPPLPAPALLAEETGLTSVAVGGGDVYWATTDGRVMRLRADGVRELIARAAAPARLVVDEAGVVYFAAGEPDVWVRGVAPDQTSRRFASPGLTAPSPVAVADGRLWVVAAGEGQRWLVAYDLGDGRLASLDALGEVDVFAAGAAGLYLARNANPGDGPGSGELAVVSWATRERGTLHTASGLRVEALLPHGAEVCWIEDGEVVRIGDDGHVSSFAAGTYSGVQLAAFVGDDLWAGCDGGSGCVLTRYSPAARDGEGHGTSYWSDLTPSEVLGEARGEAGALILVVRDRASGQAWIYRQPLP